MHSEILYRFFLWVRLLHGVKAVYLNMYVMSTVVLHILFIHNSFGWKQSCRPLRDKLFREHN